MENFDQEILGDKKYQEMAIKHAAIQGALDQEVQLLKSKCEEQAKQVHTCEAVIDGQLEELDILKKVCEETKRERDCAEKKLKEVLEWAEEVEDKTILNYDWRGGFNQAKEAVRQILTVEKNN